MLSFSSMEANGSEDATQYKLKTFVSISQLISLTIWLEKYKIDTFSHQSRTAANGIPGMYIYSTVPNGKFLKKI